MTSNFESIFNSKETKVDPGLNKIFTRKVNKHTDVEKKKKTKNAEIPDIDGIENDYESTKIRQKKMTPETEKRTVFVGNLNTDCKKEVTFICLDSVCSFI